MRPANQRNGEKPFCLPHSDSSWFQIDTSIDAQQTPADKQRLDDMVTRWKIQKTSVPVSRTETVLPSAFRWMPSMFGHQTFGNIQIEQFDGKVNNRLQIDLIEINRTMT